MRYYVSARTKEDRTLCSQPLNSIGNAKRWADSQLDSGNRVARVLITSGLTGTTYAVAHVNEKTKKKGRKRKPQQRKPYWHQQPIMQARAAQVEA